MPGILISSHCFSLSHRISNLSAMWSTFVVLKEYYINLVLHFHKDGDSEAKKKEATEAEIY